MTDLGGIMTNYEEKIKELEDRIVVLEKAEHKRKVMKRIKIVLKLLLVLIIIGFSYYLYLKAKPYIEKVKDLGGITDRAKEGKDYLKDKYNSLIGE